MLRYYNYERINDYIYSCFNLHLTIINRCKFMGLYIRVDLNINFRGGGGGGGGDMDRNQFVATYYNNSAQPFLFGDKTKKCGSLRNLLTRAILINDERVY